LWPTITKFKSVHLTDAQLDAAAAAGQISLSPDSRRSLNNIAESWTTHDEALHSPRPHEFRARLESIRRLLEKARSKADLNHNGASRLERQLFHWLLELPGGPDGLSQLAALNSAIQFLREAEQSLPPDSGRARPMDDHRFIRYLADQFQANGSKVAAYRSSHNVEGYARTPFRQFVHKFYSYLPLKTRRTRSGLDEAIRQALRGRRRQKKV
jgi:hypothetical protein